MTEQRPQLLAAAFVVASLELLHSLLVSLDHLLDHLAAYGAGLPGGQVTVVAVRQVHANLPWCPFYIVNYSPDGHSAENCPPGENSRVGSDFISPMNL